MYQHEHRRQTLALKGGLFLFVTLLVLGVWLSGVAEAVETSQSDTQLVLNHDQRQWLKKHPVIRVGIDPDFAPYEYVDRHQRHQGISSDYLAELSKLLGIQFKVVPDISWQQVMQGIQHQQIDMLAAATPTPARKQFLKFTAPYVKYQVAIVSEANRNFNSLSELRGKRVALVKSYAFTELVMRQQPGIVPVDVDTVLDGLKLVQQGRAAAMVADVGSMGYKIREFSMSDLKVSTFLDLQAEGLSMAVRGDWPELVSILNAALSTIPDARHHQIIRHWLTATEEKEPAIVLSPDEKAFIRAHPDIRLGIDPEFIPFEFIDANGAYSGMASDYIKLLNQRLGLNMRVAYSKNWKEAVQRAKQRQLDVLPSVGITDERKQYFLFSKAYIYFNMK